MNDERLYTVQELVDAEIVGDPVAGGRSRLLELLGDDVVYDPIGRPCVTEKVAVRLAEEHREENARQAEEAAKRAEQAAEHRPARGVPAGEGMTAYETLMAQDDYESPADEFGLPKPNFLEEELAAGRRAAAEKQRLAREAKEKLQ